VPIAEKTYLQARAQIEAGDAHDVSHWLRQVIKADPAESADYPWVTPGEDGPYLPYFYLGLANAMINDCVAAIDAWDESERQGEVQKTAKHAQLAAERVKCDALFAQTVDRSEKRLAQAAEFAGLLEEAAAKSEFADVWRRSPELRREIDDGLADYRALRARFEQAKQGGLGAALKLESEVIDTAKRLDELAERVTEETGG
jgi:hypothetical protein